MKYSKIRKYDTSNWDGVNTSIFFSGCTFGCPGCFNKDSQDFNFGAEYNKNIEDKFIEYAKDTHVSGVCILGGEPFQQDLDMLYDLVRRIRTEVGKPIHIWSGYTWEELICDYKKVAVLGQCNTLVDGRFDVTKKNLTIKYRGSYNQRVIDIRKSLIRGEVVEYR